MSLPRYEQKTKETPHVQTRHDIRCSWYPRTRFGRSLCAIPWARSIVDLLNKELNTVLNMPEVREQLARQSMESAGGSPEDLDKILKDQLLVWQKALNSAGIKPE